jgi:acetyl esterase/lipase
MLHRLRRFVIRAWPLLAAVAILAGMPALLRLNRYGRVFVDATLYLPDMVLQVPMPYRPVELFTDKPSRERIEIEYTSRNGPRSIEADLYTPRGKGPFSAEVFSMGAPPLDLDNKRLIRIAEDSARSGVIMLVPFSERLDDELIEPEEIDALVAEFQYLQALPNVHQDKIGFFGASVGGSLALVAAGDPRIAAHVDHVVSFGGYYDALDTFGAIATRHIRYEDVDENWSPRWHAERVMAEQFINDVSDPKDRETLARAFVDLEPVDTSGLGEPAQRVYDFLSNRDPDRTQSLIEALPGDMVQKLDYLSPRTSIDNVSAELFIVHDRADPYIPYTESRRLEDHVHGRGAPEAHFDEIRLFEHVEPKLNQRPEILAFDSSRLLYRLYQLMLRWS